MYCCKCHRFNDPLCPVLCDAGTYNKPAPNPEYCDLANTISQQAEALAQGKIPAGRVYAQVARLFDNVATLRAWTPDDRGAGT